MALQVFTAPGAGTGADVFGAALGRAGGSIADALIRRKDRLDLEADRKAENDLRIQAAADARQLQKDLQAEQLKFQREQAAESERRAIAAEERNAKRQSSQMDRSNAAASAQIALEAARMRLTEALQTDDQGIIDSARSQVANAERNLQRAYEPEPGMFGQITRGIGDFFGAGRQPSSLDTGLSASIASRNRMEASKAGSKELIDLLSLGVSPSAAQALLSGSPEAALAEVQARMAKQDEAASGRDALTSMLAGNQLEAAVAGRLESQLGRKPTAEEIDAAIYSLEALSGGKKGAHAAARAEGLLPVIGQDRLPPMLPGVAPLAPLSGAAKSAQRAAENQATAANIRGMLPMGDISDQQVGFLQSLADSLAAMTR